MGKRKADEQTPAPPQRRRDPPLTRARARATASPVAAPPPATPPSPATPPASDASETSPLTNEQVQAALPNGNMLNIMEVARNALVQQNERIARLHVQLQNTEHGPSRYQQQLMDASTRAYELNQRFISQLRPKQGTNANGHGLTDELESTTGSFNHAMNLEGRAAENTHGQVIQVITCSVCGSGPACMVFLPCKHLCACKPCGDNLAVCPICGSAKSKAIDLSEKEKKK